MSKQVLQAENILMNIQINTMEEAIRKAGEILVQKNYVEPDYIEKMLEREKITSTYMGNFIAIPHGTEDAKENVKSSGISVLQIPDGVDFGNGNEVKLVFGIAGKDNEHLDILSKIAIVCSDVSNVEEMIKAKKAEEFLEFFDGRN